MTNSNTLDTDSNSHAKGFLPFRDKSCHEISTQLWSSIALTSWRGLVPTLSSGSANSKIANSWFCAEQTYLPNQKWLKISYESSRLTIADSTDSVKTNLLSKKIRVYPETKLAEKWRTWVAASRWCYNQAIAILKNEKIGKYELRKRIMDSAPE